LPEKFILSLAMIESRKNIETLIVSYGKLSEELQNEYPLVLAYKVNPEDKKRIIELAQDNGVNINSLVFTGYLNDQDLIVLYNLCALFVFPSLHEGFGLPPLEAMKCGAATIASGTTSLPEVIGWDGAMFDPRNPDAICTLICKALTDEEYYSALKENARIQAQKFSWNISAERAIAAMEKLLDSQSQSINR
ncbi:glycosyltransferase family 4 protein, partial [Escherichia coli]|nr:glycosyltransferase family 4 protein [Escherichia coli]